MGCCCSAQQRDDSEFSKLATKPLIKHRSLSFDVPKDIKAGDLALGIHLKGCRTLQAGASGDCDPFVRFWLSSDPSKIQESTAKSRTQNPLWVPDELFHFMPFKRKDMAKTKLIISVMDRDNFGDPDPLGDCQVKLSSLEVGAEEKEFRLQLINPRTGEPLESYIDLKLEVDCAFKAHGTQEEKVYEYQRWGVVHGWSNELVRNGGSLLPTDPGRWSNWDKSVFCFEFEEVQMPLPPGWSVKKDWEVNGRPGSADGWEYAFGFRFPGWFDKCYCLMRARRRIWRRIIVNTNLSTKMNAIECN
ncbi:hypothetical protein TrST_g708 [Triparma strigata]|uniref:C2 domain-containing protein n=1 Tax=Triparma strigata TaxID=1606541 RepID=A0A9W7EKK8_9STRA|nr:hypothetical protein TrST_g708 [Triparma strigata]